MNATRASATGFSRKRSVTVESVLGQAAQAPKVGGLRTPSGLAGLVSGDLAARGLATALGDLARKAQAVSPEQRLLQRITMGPTALDRERIQEVGYQRYLDEQLDYEALDDRELEEALAHFLPTLAMSPAELVAAYGEMPQVPVFHLLLATLFRAVYSPRQLFERMTVFWTDHFNIDILSDLGPYLKPTDDREVVRRHALGTFPDLLRASAHSPAMLSYLTNDSNRKGHPNENYARELMELHTLGVDNGYTQEDVREVARCLTGWVFWPFRAGAQAGRFLFYPPFHDTDAKVVLGQAIPAGGGVEDGETVLAILSDHPNTARFIAGKMMRFLWGYEPPNWMVEQAAEVYQDTGGDLRAMLRKMLDPGWMARATAKLKRPFHLVASALRALFAEPSEPFFVLQELHTAGHLPFTWEPPNGFPDSRGYWSGFLLPRWNFTSAVVAEDASGVMTELFPYLDPRLRPAVLVRRIDALLFGGTMTPATDAELRRFLRGRRNQARVRQAVSLALAAPEFQDY